jgi:hypothetical protein
MVLRKILATSISDGNTVPQVTSRPTSKETKVTQNPRRTKKSSIEEQLAAYATRLEVRKETLLKQQSKLTKQLARLNAKQFDGYSAEVAKHFHLGMVGGSGKAVRGYNKRRERSLDATISRAKTINHLQRRLDEVSGELKAIENGTLVKLKRVRLESKSQPHEVPEDRLFAGTYPTGISYADRGREERGDYKRIAHLLFSTLSVTWYVNPDTYLPELIARVKADIADMRTRRGESYQVSTVGQTIPLGHALTKGAPIPPDTLYLRSTKSK